MKKISTLSHAKAVHAVKSIGKVLLPVALLLAAILCIGVCASAAESTYTPSNDFPGYHYVNNDPTLVQCTYNIGPACSKNALCVCGQVGKRTGDTEAHTMVLKEEAKYVAGNTVNEKAEAGKCEATTLYYTVCSKCGEQDGTTQPGTTHHYTEKGDKLDKAPGTCNELVKYKAKCACGDEDDSIYITGTTTYGHGTKESFAGKVTANMTKFNLSVADLAVNGSLCGLASEYYDFCTECGDVLTSKTTYNADSPEALAALITAIHETNDTYTVCSYNDDAHWTVCTACNTIVVSAKHTYSNTDVDCTHPQECTADGCEYVAKTVDHKYQYHAAVDATCDADGNEAYYTCTECELIFDSEKNKTTWDEVTIDATKHEMAAGAPLCNPGECTKCGKEITATESHKYAAKKHDEVNDSYNKVSVTSVTCESACEYCGSVMGTHNWESQTSAENRNCEQNYYTWQQCTTCNTVKDYKKFDAGKHTYPVLGTYECETSVECPTCGQTFKTDHKLPDNFQYNCKDGKDVRCANCDDQLPDELAGVEEAYAYKSYTDHDRQYVSATAPTCTTEGSSAGYRCLHQIKVNGVVYTCTGYDERTTIPANDHTWGDWEVTTKPTCVAKGKETRKCKVEGCNGVETRDIAIDADAHVWSTDYRVNGDNKSHYIYCTNIATDGTVCFEQKPNENHTFYVTVEGKKIEVSVADCRGDAVCVCGQTLEAVECQNSDVKYDKDGHWSVCKVCGEVTEQKVEHTYVDVPAQEATCGEAGYAAHRKCSVCGYEPDSYEKYPVAGEHKWGKWDYADNAYNKGDKVANNAQNKQNTYHYRKCETCGEIDSHKSVSDNAANCMYPNRCTTCELTILKSKNSRGECKDVEQKALGHDLVGVTTVVTESTHSVTCKRCNETIVEAHKLSEGAACVDNECAVCDYVIKATGKHTAPADVQLEFTDSGHTFECVDCGKTVTEDHDFNFQAVDCMADIKCKVCEFFLYEGYNSHDIDFSDPVDAVAPTCTTAGHSVGFKCTRCQFVYGGTILPATGHSFQLVAGKAATETEDGYTQHFACSECGATEGKEVLPKTGAPVLKGDFNADGKLSSDDAIALLKLIMFGGEADQSLDYDGDGKADSADAIALLKAAMFG